MLKHILSILSGDTPENKMDETDAKLAMAALLVRVARADDDYDAREIEVIDTVLAKNYQLTTEQAQALRIEAEALEEQAPDTVRFTRVIKEAVPFEERSHIIESLWQVVLADEHRDEDEDSFLRLVSNLLGVNDRDSAIARQNAQASIQG